MKKALLILSIAAIAGLPDAKAQIKKGATMLRATVNGSTADQENNYTNMPSYEDHRKNISTGIGFGKAIRQNMIIGVNGTYGGSSYKADNSPDMQRYRSYGGGFFVRKYQQLAKSDFYLFADGYVYGNFSKSTFEGQTGGTEKITSVGLSLAPGVSYAVNNWLQLEVGLNDLASFSYSTRRLNGSAGESVVKTFGGGLNLQGTSDLYVGFTFLLN